MTIRIKRIFEPPADSDGVRGLNWIKAQNFGNSSSYRVLPLNGVVESSCTHWG